MNSLQPLPSALATLGSEANRVAAVYAFEEYRSRKSKNTLSAHDDDLALFSRYLEMRGAGRVDLLVAENWQHITWGLVDTFIKWMLIDSYAVASVNRALSTIKVYAKVAAQSGTLPRDEYAMIRAVMGYSKNEADNLDKKRGQTRKLRESGQPVKKAAAVMLTGEQAKALKNQPDTPQGRRDRLLMCLLLDHGLRESEVALLKVGNLSLETKEMRFYRPKVKKEQTHYLSRDTLAALKAWAGHIGVFNDLPLLKGSRKGGELTTARMSERAIVERVKVLGERIGVIGLSPHDCRHYWATKAARNKVGEFRLQEAGGWNSLEMPRRYVAESAVANEGMEDLE